MLIINEFKKIIYLQQINKMILQRVHITRNLWESPSIKGLFCYDAMLINEAKYISLDKIHV